jgi:peroxiredoxin
MPATELLHRQLKEKGLIVLGINDEDSEQQSRFLRKVGHSFSSLVEPVNKIKNLYKVLGIPTTVLIDAEGKIRAYELDASYETMWKAVHNLGGFRNGASD